MYDLWLNLKRAESLLKLKHARKWFGPSWLQITTVFSQTGFKLLSKTGSVKWDNGVLLLKRAWILALLKHQVMFGALQTSIHVSSSCRWFELKKPYMVIQKDASADLLDNADTDEMSINSICTPTERCSCYIHRRVGGNAQIRVENLPLSSIIGPYQKYLGKRDNPQSFSSSLLKRSCKVFCPTSLSSFPFTQQLTPTKIKEMFQYQAARWVQKMLAAKYSDYLNKYSMDLTI